MNIHFIGIGGVGMAGLAVLLKNRGHVVSGCDAHLGGRTRWLEAQGIRVAEGHDPRHLDGVDWVVVTPAVHGDNAELRAARETLGTENQSLGVGVRYRGEVLAEIVSAADDAIAVCGSHGKTTTATWIARLLIALGESVEWAIGGETGDFPVAGKTCLVPDTKHVLVVEADESDGTLAQYHAHTLVVTNCEYDHPDHFKTRADYVACYAAARRNAGDVVEGERLELLDKLEGLEQLEGLDNLAFLARLAPHNRQNARVAIEVALRRGHKPDAIVAALPAIVAALPDRRFQKIAEGVFADYAHHPTEMRCAIQMARAVCLGKLFVLFQPHRYSRTKALLNDFPAAFEGADEVVLCPTYAAFESPIAGGDVSDLYRACRDYFDTGAQGQRDGRCAVALAESCAAAWARVRARRAPGDIVLLLGAGDIINLVPVIQKDLGGATCK